MNSNCHDRQCSNGSYCLTLLPQRLRYESLYSIVPCNYWFTSHCLSLFSAFWRSFFSSITRHRHFAPISNAHLSSIVSVVIWMVISCIRSAQKYEDMETINLNITSASPMSESDSLSNCLADKFDTIEASVWFLQLKSSAPLSAYSTSPTRDVRAPEVHLWCFAAA